MSRRHSHALIAAATLVVGTTEATAQLQFRTVTWLTASQGSWREAVKWSGGFIPINGQEVHYTAIIGATGADYTVTLDLDVTVDDFVLASPNAKLEHTTGLFSVLNGPITLVAGSYRLSGGVISGGSITQNGGSFVPSSGGGVLSGTAVIGDLALLEAGAKVELRSGADFTGDANLAGASSLLGYEYDATIGAGRTINLDGAGAIVSISQNPATNASCTLTVAQGATIRGGGIISSGAFTGGTGNVLVNAGIISADSGTGLTITTDVLVNQGAIQATNGAVMTIAAPTFSNGPGGTLAALEGSRIIAENINGPLNKSVVSGAGGLISLHGTYTINDAFSVTDHATLMLRGNWTRSATIDASGQVILDYIGNASPLATIITDILSGRNGGAWNGSGINSSGAAATAGTAVGFAEASDVLSPSGGSFAGQSVDGSAVLVRWTFEGDADLNGAVDVADLGRLATSWQSTAPWSKGDFNYDGTVNVGDLGLLATNWQSGAGLLGSATQDLGELLSGLGLPTTVVPEPTCWAAPSATLLCNVGRRRSRRRDGIG